MTDMIHTRTYILQAGSKYLAADAGEMGQTVPEGFLTGGPKTTDKRITSKFGFGVQFGSGFNPTNRYISYYSSIYTKVLSVM